MANVPIPSLPVAIALDGSEQMEIVQGGTSKRTTTQAIANKFANNMDGSITWVIDGGGFTVPGGNSGYEVVPWDATIVGVELLVNPAGSISIDIQKCGYAQFDAGITHPVAADTITAGNYPAIASGSKYSDTSLVNWTVSLKKGDILGFVVNSVMSVARVTITLNVTRSVNPGS